MKQFFPAVLLACAIAPAHAQNEPSEVRDSEIAKYKQVAQSACRDAGKQRGDPEEQVNAVCSCLIAHLEKSMSRVEWQQASLYSIKQQGEEEQRIVVPHLKTFRGCPAPAEQAPAKPAAPAAKP